MSNSAKNGTSECPESVLELTTRFELHRDTYKKPTYNETQVRREFIDPLFAALGWDVDNEQGHAEAYKDVIHEDAIKIGGSTKAPDYCFRIGGVRKFFVEAKKPAEAIKEKREHAYQLRRYAWTAKLPVSILTDFEEFAVFDCTKRPKPTDQASTGRILYITCEEYTRRWDEVASVFSKDAILKGAFDKFAESAKRKRGTSEVDDEFLKEIEQWRDWLARNIALRNPGLSIRELNFAVTKTIDRIIFLRMCEDRGVETYAQLRILPGGPNIYPRLVDLFRRADERYNSGLFHFEHEKGRTEEPDTLTPGLTIDDKVLKDIIKRLYYPECPYEFSVMPPEILGQVYEQFLGKVITLTAGHHAKVESKPEVKKAGGVYYTPKYIVDYIVEHTVGKLLEDKTPPDVGPMLDQRSGTRARKQSRKGKRPVPTLCILDPACGSGSFLLGAYQYLLDWHLRSYTDNDPEAWARKKNPPIYQSAKLDPTAKGTTWRLTVAERKRILLNNIFGVDIDPQAVEVTKLSLLLKVLEGESQQTLDNQLRLFHERALPDLAANIKCGNSLIGPDFYEGKQLDLLDEEERYRINVFDWQAEFPEVFAPSRASPKQNPDRQGGAVQTDTGTRPLPHGRGSEHAGGFDAVIGNPPYGIVFCETVKAYFECAFPAFIRNNETFVCFVQRAVSLLASKGRFGFIIPNTFLRGPYFDDLKRHLLAEANLNRIVDFGSNLVFNDANVFTALLFLERGQSGSPTRQRSCEYFLVNDPAHLPGTAPSVFMDTNTIASLCWSPQGELVRRMQLTDLTVGDVAWVKDVGLNYWTKGRGKKRGGSIADRVLYSGPVQHSDDQVYIKGRDISRYKLHPGLQWLRHDYADRLDPEVDTFRFSPEFLKREKLVYRQTADRIIASVDSQGLLTDKTVHVIVPKDESDPRGNLKYLLALLNSSLIEHYYRSVAQEGGRAFAQVKIFRTRKFPLPDVNVSEPPHSETRVRLMSLVDGMLLLHKQLDAAKTPTDKTTIQRQIDATDKQIDQLVYELYALTDDEIRIVEEARSA